LKRWLSWIALVLVFATACGFLSKWQFDRRATKVAAIALVQRNYLKPVADLSNVSTPSGFSVPTDSWRRVKIFGRYVPEKMLLVRDRPNNGNPGFEELVPFVTNTGKTIFVSRGWLPSGSAQDKPDEVPLPTSEPIILIGRVVAEEPMLSRGAPNGQIATINISLANRQAKMHKIVRLGYLRAVSESPANKGKLFPMPPPATEEGNNLSYAIQWIIFAIMAAAALIWRIRKDQQIAAGIVVSRRKTRADIDAEVEDSMTVR